MKHIKLLSVGVLTVLWLVSGSHTVRAATTNIITNGGFENDTAGWECGYNDYCSTTSSISYETAYNGNYYYYLSPLDSLEDNFVTLSQTVTVPSNTHSLQLNFAYQFYLEDDDSLNDGFFGVSVESLDGNTTYFSQYWSSNEDKTYDWTQFSTYIDGDLAGQTVKIQFFTKETWPWATSGYIDEVSLIASDAYHVDAPDNLFPWVTERKVKLSWDAVENSQYYKVQIADNAGKIIKKFKNVTKNKLTLLRASFKENERYKFHVKACYLQTCSVWSDYETFTIKY
ncbi:MAG: fibronectin type III domain-containing protein [Patescibacteria group bacterium]|jgi:hypothetical protein